MSSSFALFFVVMTVTLTMAISAADDVLGYDMTASQEMAAKTQGDEELTTVHYDVPSVVLDADVNALQDAITRQDLPGNANVDDETTVEPTESRPRKYETTEVQVPVPAVNGEVQESEKNAETGQESGGNAETGQESEKNDVYAYLFKQKRLRKKNAETGQESGENAESVQESETNTETVQESEKNAETVQESEKNAGADQESEGNAEIGQESEKKAETGQESEKKAETVQESEGNAETCQESEKKAETGTSKQQQNDAARGRVSPDFAAKHLEKTRFVDFTEVAAPLPTLTIEEFENDSTGMYRKFLRPFKLKAGFDNKPAKKKWTRGFFGKDSRFSQEIVAYYPDNLRESGKKHYGRLTNAINEISKNGFIKADTPMYLLWNMLPGAWNELGKDIKLPEAFNTDKWWQSQCLSEHDGRLLEEYFIKTHWGMLIMGTTGAGMYNHSDALQAASWQAQVSGSKWWYLCGDLQHFAPDGETVITGEFKCFEDVVDEGDILFYPSNFYHMTSVVDQPCFSYTGTQLDPVNYRSIMDSLHGECVYEKHNYRFSGMLCDALDKCYKLWDKKFRGKRERKKMKRWRKAAGKTNKQKRFSISPWDNLYKTENHDANRLHL